ncbi:InlB B-repeat-containing protein [Candidatus Saccharibacteria bacterium]|nr:InlB B-repeat-containing protein [Candidatus Saccharibacteria bacterium]
MSMVVDGSVLLDVEADDGNITTDVVTVNTDCLNGYTLSVGAPADSNLYLDGDSANDTSYISPTSGTMAFPTSIIGAGKFNTWGISMDSNTTVSSNTFFNIPNEGIEIYSKDSPSGTGGDDITIFYGASASSDLKAGAYTMVNGSEITYYLVAHPGTIVYFDANGGTTPSFESKEVVPGQPYGELPTTTKNGYTLLGWSKYILPAEYQAVEYIESTGTQYIDTGVIPSDTTGIYGKLSSNQIVDDSIYFGSRANKNNRFWIGNWKKSIYFGWNENTYRQINITDDSKYIVKMNYLNDRKSIFDDELIKDFSDITLGPNAYSIHVFAGNDDGDPSYNAKMKLYEFRISVGSTIAHEYIPCYRKNDGTIGLYDVVDEVFYENQGTGTFNKGNDTSYITSQIITPQTVVSSDENHTLYAIWGKNITVAFDANGGEVSPSSKTINYDSTYGELPTPTKAGYNFVGWKTENNGYTLPNEYQEVEYIESTGSQYINTGVLTSDATGIYARVLSTDVSNDLVYFGSRKGSADTRFWIANKSRQIYYGWNTNTFRPGTIYTTDINRISLNYLNDRRAMYNNEVVKNIDTTLDASNNLPIFIFAGNTGSASYKSKIKLYEFKISVGASIEHSYIACYRKSDNIIGLYDVVSDAFYTNNGTGTFYVGRNMINEYVTPSTKVIKNEDHALYAQWQIIPTFTVTGNPTSWQNTDVTLTIVPDQAGTYQYSFDGGSTWQDNPSHVFSGNQTVEMKIKTPDGIVSGLVTENITKIDKVAPTITYANSTEYNADHTTKTVTTLITTLGKDDGITTGVTTSDDASGVASGFPACSRNGVSIVSTDVFTNIGRYAIVCIVQDNAGNQTVANREVLVRWPTGGKYIVKKTEIDGPGIVATGLAVTGSSDGLFEDSADTGADSTLPFASKYYYSGAVVDNHLSFAGTDFKIFNISTNDDIKIISTASSETVSMGNAKIYDSSVYNAWSTVWWPNGQIYNSSDSHYKVFSDTEKTHIDLATFYVGRIDKTADSNIAAIINAERTNTTRLGDHDNSPSFEGYSAYPNPSDFMKAANVQDVIYNINQVDTASTQSQVQKWNSHNWVDMNDEFWTMNGRTGTLLQDSDFWTIDNDFGGRFESRSATISPRQYRPVLYITSDTIVSGTGSSQSPYTVQEDWAWFDSYQVVQ